MIVESFFAAILALGAGSASANWLLNDQIASGGGGFEIHRLFVKLVPAGADAGAKGLRAVNVRISTTNDMKIKFADINFDNIPDADVTGRSVTDFQARTSTDASTLGSFIRAGDPSAGMFVLVSSDPANPHSKDADGNGIPDPGFDPSVNYATAVRSLHVEGVVIGQDAKLVTDPSGSLFAELVVPTGTKVDVSGLFTADNGATFFLDPEPALLGPAAVCGMLLGRRRRARR